MRITRSARVILVLALVALSTVEPAAGQTPQPAPAVNDPSLLDLTRATVVTPSGLSLQERTAVRVLVEEVAKRTNIRLPVSTQWPADAVPVIAVGPIDTAPAWAGAGLRGAPPAGPRPNAEGYRVAVNPGALRGQPRSLPGSTPAAAAPRRCWCSAPTREACSSALGACCARPA